MSDTRGAANSRRDVLMGATAALVPVAGAPAPPPNSPEGGALRRPTGAFDREAFVQRCLEANRNGGQAAVRDVLARAVADHSALLAALPPTRAGMDVLHQSADLTVFAAAWTPQMNLMPHDHRMWALIGIYTGREDNIFWRRREGRLVATGANALFEGDVAAMGADAIHSVTNPLLRFTGGLHIYGGDFFHTTRSQWDPESLAEGPSDGD